MINPEFTATRNVDKARTLLDFILKHTTPEKPFPHCDQNPAKVTLRFTQGKLYRLGEMFGSDGWKKEFNDARTGFDYIKRVDDVYIIVQDAELVVVHNGMSWDVDPARIQAGFSPAVIEEGTF